MKNLAIIGVSDYPSRKGGYDSYVKSVIEHNDHANVLKIAVYVESDKDWVQESMGPNTIKIQIRRIRGMFGLIVHRIKSVEHASRNRFENIYLLSYVAFPFLHRYMYKNSFLITNMDGLEWARTEYNLFKRLYLRYAERCAVKRSNALVADSIAIQKYLSEKYGVHSTFIPYPSKLPSERYLANRAEILKKYSVSERDFYLVVGRCVRENHILEVATAFTTSKSNKKMIIATDRRKNLLRSKLEDFAAADSRFVYVDPIYDENELDVLRDSCFAYLHGHSVGGTNPSLLESLTTEKPIIAHRNSFNLEVLGDTALYFSSLNDLEGIFGSEHEITISKETIQKRLELARKRYGIEVIATSLAKLLR